MMIDHDDQKEKEESGEEGEDHDEEAEGQRAPAKPAMLFSCSIQFVGNHDHACSCRNLKKMAYHRRTSAEHNPLY